jgi:hypothetical protein
VKLTGDYFAPVRPLVCLPHSQPRALRHTTVLSNTGLPPLAVAPSQVPRTSPRPTKAPTQPLERCVNALAARCPHHGACPSASVSHSPLSLSHSPLQRVRDIRQIHSSGAGATLAPLALSSLPLVTCLAADASHTHRPTRALHLHPGSSWGCEGHFTSPTLRRSHGRAGEPSSDEAAQGCALRASRCTDRRVQPDSNPPAPVLADLNKYPVEGFSAGLVDETNVFEWEIMIMGPPDTH